MRHIITELTAKLVKTGPTHDFPEGEFYYWAEAKTDRGPHSLEVQTRICPTAYEAFNELAKLLPEA